MSIALPTIVQVTLLIMHYEIITTLENCDIVMRAPLPTQLYENLHL